MPSQTHVSPQPRVCRNQRAGPARKARMGMNQRWGREVREPGGPCTRPGVRIWASCRATHPPGSGSCIRLDLSGGSWATSGTGSSRELLLTAGSI